MENANRATIEWILFTAIKLYIVSKSAVGTPVVKHLSRGLGMPVSVIRVIQKGWW